ncbi:putative nucleotidyltransferase [Cyclonatronum proteinivorum]|uniref:Putative nucleotidyltransferase n=1 Tax=Cyclonatronum proteinivorum TaxID=1457365 RepID=A0A345UMK0_9BACT|nr:nucleotidyltransferase domain-containing protein [Cyclonatronum proteinivorum]AXJ01702.1 putative nucleotidyltransferase [Cyclonatronum proteinivorum]
MTKSQRKTIITDFLLRQDDVLFVVFFGSFAQEGYERYRDIDVAVFMTEIPELLRQGYFISELEHLCGCRVDVVILNDLYKTNPLLSQEIVGRHIMIPNMRIRPVDEVTECFAGYCVRSLRAFEDTRYLRRLMSEAFTKRLKNHQFAQFDLVNQD